MAKLTGQEFQEKWNRRLKGSIEDIRSGVNKVTESPTAKAAQKQEKMIQNLTAAVSSGKWKAGLQRVSLEEWKQKTLDKGLGRIASGADGATDKVAAFGTQLMAYQDTLKASVDKMPDLGLQDSISRMTAWVTGMSKFQRK